MTPAPPDLAWALGIPNACVGSRSRPGRFLSPPFSPGGLNGDPSSPPSGQAGPPGPSPWRAPVRGHREAGRPGPPRPQEGRRSWPQFPADRRWGQAADASSPRRARGPERLPAARRGGAHTRRTRPIHFLARHLPAAAALSLPRPPPSSGAARPAAPGPLPARALAIPHLPPPLPAPCGSFSAPHFPRPPLLLAPSSCSSLAGLPPYSAPRPPGGRLGPWPPDWGWSGAPSPRLQLVAAPVQPPGWVRAAEGRWEKPRASALRPPPVGGRVGWLWGRSLQGGGPCPETLGGSPASPIRPGPLCSFLVGFFFSSSNKHLLIYCVRHVLGTGNPAVNKTEVDLRELPFCCGETIHLISKTHKIFIEVKRGRKRKQRKKVGSGSEGSGAPTCKSNI